MGHMTLIDLGRKRSDRENDNVQQNDLRFSINGVFHSQIKFLSLF